MKKIWQRYFEPTPRCWRVIGDVCLVLSGGVLEWLLITLQQMPGADPDQIFWAVRVVDFLIVTKFTSNLARLARKKSDEGPK